MRGASRERVRDLRTVEIAYVLLTSTLLGAVPLVALRTGERLGWAVPGWRTPWLAAALLAWAVGVALRALRILRAFETAVRPPG